MWGLLIQTNEGEIYKLLSWISSVTQNNNISIQGYSLPVYKCLRLTSKLNQEIKSLFESQSMTKVASELQKSKDQECMAPILSFTRKNQTIEHTICWSNQKNQECMAPIWPFTRKDQGIKHTFCRSKQSWCWLRTLQQATYSHISDYPCCILTSLNCATQ